MESINILDAAVCCTLRAAEVLIAKLPLAVVAVKVRICGAFGVATSVKPSKLITPFTAAEVVPASM